MTQENKVKKEPTGKIELIGRVVRIIHEPQEFSEVDNFYILALEVKQGEKARNVKGFSAIRYNIGDSVKCCGNEIEYNEKYRSETLNANEYMYKIVPETQLDMIKYLESRVGDLAREKNKKLPKLDYGIIIEMVLENKNFYELLKQLINDPIKVERLNLAPKKEQKFIDLFSRLKPDFEFFSIAEFLVEECGLKTDEMISVRNLLGLESEKKIRQNPYLLIDTIKNYGFKKADKLAKKFKINEQHPIRIREAINYIVKESYNKNRNMAIKESDLYEKFEDLIGYSLDDIPELYKTTISNEELFKRAVIGEDYYVYLIAPYKQEVKLVEKLQNILTAPPNFDPDKVSMESLNNFLDKSIHNDNQGQRDAIINAFKSKVSIITGGPGTGKTTIVKAILDLYHASNLFAVSNSSIALVAPTGKAAKRLQKKTESLAITIHKFLGYKKGEFFAHYDEIDQLEYKLVIIDEASMVDTKLFSEIVSAINEKTQLIIVGDVDQLPSIAAGNVLKDLIKSNKIKTSVLTEVKRQDKTSSIIKNAHELNKGLPIAFNNESDCRIYETVNDDESIDTIIDILQNQIPELISKFNIQLEEKKNLFDINDYVQILSPQHKGTLGNIALNNIIQNLFNQEKRFYERTKDKAKIIYKLNDKVMITKNDADLNLSNGDIGKIIKLYTKEELKTLPEEKKEYVYKKDSTGNIKKVEAVLEVQFEEAKHKFSVKDLEDLIPSYAMSIHKSQGSEYPIVIIPLTKQHDYISEKKLYYTGLTRAKQLMIFVGQKYLLDKAARTNKSNRITGLNQHFKQQDILNI